MDPQVLLLVAGGALLVLAVRRWLAGRWLRKVRGPPSPGWLLGHSKEFELNVGDLESEYIAKYGAVYKKMAPLGEHLLHVADPKALQYMLHKSGYHFQKSVVSRTVSGEITGPGILVAQDQDHSRQRKIMNPAFTAAQLRSFLPIFRSSAQKLSQKWQDVLQNEPGSSKKINVLATLTRCTLDIIGEVGFDVQFGAMDEKLNPVMEAYKDMFADSIAFPSTFTVLFQRLWYYIPTPILKYVKYMPGKDHARFRRTLKIINEYSKKLIDEKTEAVLAGNEKKKDIMSILVKANSAESQKERLTDEEMIAQMATFLLAGHETTASSMSWLLWELSRHTEYQSKMREEIKAVRARVAARGDQDFSVSDLDSMTYCLAAQKEVLRLHPIAYLTERQAGRDDVLPLAYPITLSDGEVVNELPIPKGTTLRVSNWAYNRLPQIWGPDANEFNPMRFIEQEKMGATYVGVTSNLMTFSAGLQACIGWRFSIIEMQALLVELIEKFEFSIPEDKPEIIRFAGGLMTPLVASEMHLGSQMPLQVSLVQ
ncbi:PAH-inducible cytochrome P450 monooxygenase PC-PAH 1 [Polyporus arcularius HHB13444]|uniref:PAH-inducible cytochrome P450 monooxygenase PC-PAH 1 n=1 Tax=Polyporus arcularius HHB13444 TaxID=1314778 RepID=A0A5C3Q2Z7_9APHY|nr:PAH-inducible cytochrome P450 monooxygenase PC-PAH 1 [Polyporus arcularius HHB13444]